MKKRTLYIIYYFVSMFHVSFPSLMLAFHFIISQEDALKCNVDQIIFYI